MEPSNVHVDRKQIMPCVTAVPTYIDYCSTGLWPSHTLSNMCCKHKIWFVFFSFQTSAESWILYACHLFSSSYTAVWRSVPECCALQVSKGTNGSKVGGNARPHTEEESGPAQWNEAVVEGKLKLEHAEHFSTFFFVAFHLCLHVFFLRTCLRY